MVNVSRIFEETDRGIVQQLLQSGLTVPDIAEKWDCDTTPVYRQLRRWSLNTRGEEAVSAAPNRDITKRQMILNYISHHGNEITVLSVCKAVKVSQDLVRETLIEQGIKLKQPCRINEINMKRSVMLAMEYISDDFPRMQAIEMAGLTEKQFYYWRSKLEKWQRDSVKRAA